MKTLIHSCRIHCHSMDLDKADLIGIKDQGKWLPFAFHMDMVVACKMTTDDAAESVNGCTTIFTDNGDTFIIDTPYERFFTKFLKHYAPEQEEDSLPEL